MKRFLVFSLVVFVIPILAIADGNTASNLINPPASGLKVKRVIETPYEILFSGQIWVSGIFRAEWHPNNPGSKPAYLLAVGIKPDNSELDHLPHFGSDKAAMIRLSDERAAVHAVFSKIQADQFMKRKMQVLEVHGRFLLKNYSAGECGSSWASADMVSAKITDQAVVGAGLEIGDC